MVDEARKTVDGRRCKRCKKEALVVLSARRAGKRRAYLRYRCTACDLLQDRTLDEGELVFDEMSALGA